MKMGARARSSGRFDGQPVAQLAAMARAFGMFRVLCWDREGRLKFVEEFDNIVTNEGLTRMLGVHLSLDTQITTRYIALWNGSSPTASSTYAVPIYTEVTAYDEATRPTWGEGGVQAGPPINLTNATAAEFTISGTVTVNGAALVSNATKGGTTGGHELYAAGAFSVARDLVDNDILNVTYTTNLADDGA